MDKHKLGIIVPYRNRPEQLEFFKWKIKKYLKVKKIPFEIYIIHQDDAKLFNRGMLLNIGYGYAKKDECDYLVFHDVDMIPFRVNYSYSEIPLHLASRFKNVDREIFDEYFGGVTLFPIKTFEKINGYSNKYWGWGYEDTDLLFRCVKNNVSLDVLKLRNQNSNIDKLRFNGVNSYIRGKNNFDMKKPITFFISFKPDELTLNFEQYSDDFNILTIPGYDFSIYYNSYSRYSVCLFNKENQPLIVSSKITKEYYTNIAISIDELNQEIKVYQDGELLKTLNDFGDLYDYSLEEYFYIGMGNPLSDSGFKYFKGLFDKFIVFEGSLNENEIFDLSKNIFTNPNNRKEILQYDTTIIEDYKLKDLSNSGNDGEIFNCEIDSEEISDYREVKIPFRRECIFISLPHEENGFVNNAWKDQSTRWNELRFYNEVTKNDDLVYNEGLSTLEFTEHGILDNEDNIKHINVGI